LRRLGGVGRSVYDVDEEGSSVEANRMSEDQFDGFVEPPSNLLVQISNDPSIDNFKWSLGHVRQNVLGYLSKVDRDFGSMTNVLDLGCGVGRFLFAMKPVLKAGQQLYGCDVNKDCADWAAANVSFAKVQQNGVDASTGYPDNHFDFIYALSVFTHLSVPLQFFWAWELFRILKPNGVLFFSTHGPGHGIRAVSLSGEYFKTKELDVFDLGTMVWVFSTDGEKANEGQREVAITHSLDAPAMVMSSLTPIFQEGISTMAAGQTINMFRKDKTGRIYAAMEERMIEPGWGLFRLESGENGSVSGTVMFDSPNYSVSQLAIVPLVKEAGGAAVRSSRKRIAVNAAFGPGHYINWRVEFAKTDQPVEVSLRVEDKAGKPVKAGQFWFVRSEP
jgi:SAM-dependent methyltransferase